MATAVGNEGEAPAGVDDDIVVFRRQAVLHVGQADLHLFEVGVDAISNTAEVGHQPHAVANADGRGVLL